MIYKRCQDYHLYTCWALWVGTRVLAYSWRQVSGPTTLPAYAELGKLRFIACRQARCRKKCKCKSFFLSVHSSTVCEVPACALTHLEQHEKKKTSAEGASDYP